MHRWSMKFEDARVEQAYIESRHDEMLLNLARLNGLFVIGIMTTFVSPLARALFGWYGGCREGGFHTADLMQRGFMVFSMTLFACLFYMPFYLPGLKKRLGFRWCEVYVTCWSLIPLFVPLWYSQRSAHGWVNNEADFTPEATCYYYAEFTARSALTMDCAMTLVHIMVPIRWSVIFWTEVVYVIVFNMQSFLLLQDQGDFGILTAFTFLIIGASVGLRSIEKNHRLHFSTLIRERELRAGAEFEAELGFKSMMKWRKKQQQSREDTASNAHSAPSTTATGRVFAQIVGNDSLESDLSLLVQLGIEEQWLLNPDEVSFSSGAVLGQGGFGMVVEASFCGGSVAVKHYMHSSSRSTGGGKKMQPVLDESSVNELRILRHVRHPHIVLFHGALIGEGFLDVSLVFEKIVGTRFDHAVSDIHEWKRSNFGASISRYQHALLCGVCEALTYLHTRRPCVVHADVKPGNIMVEQRNNRPFPKLLDFGLSRIATRGAKINGGTRHFTAPEVVGRTAGRASPAVDVFAFGQLMFYVGSGQHPKSFRDDEQTWKRGPGILMQWKAAIQYCRRSDPAMRPTMKQVSEMIFFSSLLGHSDSEGNDKTEEEQSQADAQAEVLQHAQTTGIRRKAIARHLMEAIGPLDEVSKTTRRVDRSESDPEIGRQTAAWGLSL